MTKKHAGKTVLITGGASGIGLAIAERFQAEGATLALFDLSEEALDKARETLSASGSAPVSWSSNPLWSWRSRTGSAASIST